MADVEDADGLADRGVLGDSARIRDGHVPTAELGEGGAQGGVTIGNRAGEEFSHADTVSPSHTGSSRTAARAPMAELNGVSANDFSDRVRGPAST